MVDHKEILGLKGRGLDQKGIIASCSYGRNPGACAQNLS